MHQHTHGTLRLPPGLLRRARIILAAIVIPLLVLTLLGMGLLWPRGETKIHSLPLISAGMERGLVQVTSLDPTQCELSGVARGGASLGVDPEYRGSSSSETNSSSGESSSEGAGSSSRANTSSTETATADGEDTTGNATASNGDLVESAVCARVLQGQGEGQIVPVHIPPESRQAVHVGSQIKVLYDPSAITSGTPFIFWDIARGKALVALAVIYLVLVIAVAGRRGFLALVGLLGSTAVLVFFIIPAFMTGSPPMLVTIIGTSAILFLSVYLAHGVTIRTTTALLGTFIGLAITIGLAYWGTWAAGITGATGEDAQMLITYFPNLTLPSLFTCGAVIAGLGALNDVTITQASSVWELDEANPRMSKWKLFSRAMRIGRDHIASTVYTLAFAYVGTALPTLMLALMVDRSALELMTVSDLAEEIVRTLVASIGLVLAIPATTGIGVILVRAVRSGGASGRGRAVRDRDGLEGERRVSVGASLKPGLIGHQNEDGPSRKRCDEEYLDRYWE